MVALGLVAARRLSLVAASRGYSSLRCTCFSLRWLLLLRSTGSRRTGFSSCSTQAQQLWHREVPSSHILSGKPVGGRGDSGAELVSETNVQKSGYKNRGTLVGQGKGRRENCITQETVLQLTCHINGGANHMICHNYISTSCLS